MKSKEYYSIQSIIDIQQKENILVNTSIIATNKELKYFSTDRIRADILAVGTSRVMQFRDFHFKKNVSFYNAGGVATDLKQYIDFFNGLSYSPKIVILGLDQYFFNEDFAKERQSDLVIDGSRDRRKLFTSAFKMTYSNVLMLRYVNSYPENIGLNAVSFSDGFRADGSYFYNRILNHPELELTQKMVYPFEDTMSRIKKGNGRFEYSNNVYLKAIKQVEEILQICDKKGIHVIAFLPPYAPLVNERMQAIGKYGYIQKIHESLKIKFEHYGYEIYDFTNLSRSTNNQMYIDGFHGNEEVYGIILQNIKNENSNLSIYIK
ncbi:hypothetical protein AB3N59_17660 [Leptospira sp. WS92.C1]